MRNISIEAWLADLARPTPTPGGGAVAALSVATSAGLTEMVARYTTGPAWADRADEMERVAAEAGRLRAEALALANDDQVAFTVVRTAYQFPRTTSREQGARDEAVQAALVVACVPPAQIGLLACRLVQIAGMLAHEGNPRLVSDVAVAVAGARSALEAAIVTILANQRQIHDATETARLGEVLAQFDRALRAADQVTVLVMETLRG